VTSLADALLGELSPEALQELADRLAPLLAARLDNGRSEGWLDVAAAAEHLSCPTSRVYSLVSAHRIPVHRDGTRLLFDREELDQWVRDGGASLMRCPNVAQLPCDPP
jgi:excisionase family DNA binding protein